MLKFTLCQKYCVFWSFLKVCMHMVFFILSGKELHTAGAAYVKSLVPSAKAFLTLYWT